MNLASEERCKSREQVTLSNTRGGNWRASCGFRRCQAVSVTRRRTVGGRTPHNRGSAALLLSSLQDPRVKKFL